MKAGRGRGNRYGEDGKGRICKLTSSGSEQGELIVRSKCLMLKAFGGWGRGRRSTDIGEWASGSQCGDERGCEGEDVGGNRERRRWRRADWIPPGGEPVRLNNGSAEQHWLGLVRWEMTMCLPLFLIPTSTPAPPLPRKGSPRPVRHFLLGQHPWAINPSTCCTPTNCLSPLPMRRHQKRRRRVGESGHWGRN